MGWKSFKEHFKIEHTVHIKEDFLLIGSAYVSDLVSISLKTGQITNNNPYVGGQGFLQEHYPEILKTNPKDILALLKKEDVFRNKIAIYYGKDGEIIETYCEEIGWPNVTYDGQVMYDNTHFTERSEAVKRELSELQSWMEFYKAEIPKKEKELSNLKTKMKSKLSLYEKLKLEKQAKKNE